MIDAITFIGKPIRFKDKCWIYPPTVNDAVANPNFNQYRTLLTLEQEDLDEQLLNKLQDNETVPTPFEYLLINSYHSKEFEVTAIKAFELFTHQTVTFLYEHKKIIFGSLQEAILNAKTINDIVCLEEDDYFEFQNAIRVSMGENSVEPDVIDPDEDPRITRIKKKAKLRDRIKKKKGVQGGITLTTSLVSICCMGIGITPLNIGELSYASVSVLMRVYQEREKYDIDIQSLLAGADSKKVKPKYWIRNATD